MAWITERKEVLALFFGLLSLNAYLSYVERRRLGTYLMVLVLLQRLRL